jgi:hypothetical protein
MLFPKNKTELKEILSYANKNNLVIHPISAGKNWGYSDDQPYLPNQIILNL